jgi:hypothetical protein
VLKVVSCDLAVVMAARGVRLVATDLDWVHGSGPQVTGPAEALMMAMAARPDALDQLTGPGKALLAQRICAQAAHRNIRPGSATLSRRARRRGVLPIGRD